MKRLFSFFFALSLALFGLTSSATALSIEDLPINFSDVLSPQSLEGGENLTVERNDNDPNKSLLTIIDKRNDHRIEVYARMMEKETHANKLFDVFYEQLKKKNVSIENKSDNFQYVTDIKGKKVKYLFDTNIALIIQTFAFSVPAKDSQTAAIIVIGYYPQSNQEEGEALFDEIVLSLLKKD